MGQSPTIPRTNTPVLDPATGLPTVTEAMKQQALAAAPSATASRNGLANILLSQVNLPGAGGYRWGYGAGGEGRGGGGYSTSGGGYSSSAHGGRGQL